MDMDTNEENTEILSQAELCEDADEGIISHAEGFDFRLFLRACRKKFSSYIRNKKEKNFTNILYVTLECPNYVKKSNTFRNPIEFANGIKQQYPGDDIRLLVPLIGLPIGTKASKKISLDIDGHVLELEKTSVHAEIYAQNVSDEAIVYKFKKDNGQIQVYGLYSQSFSYLQSAEELEQFEHLAIFLKSVRAVIRNMAKENFMPDIVHADRIPFFMGSEFESRLPLGLKVFQTIDDFVKPSLSPKEPFWAAINLADKNTMTKICRDVMVQKCISRLFNFSAKNFAPKMRECLDSIYKNYNNFIEYSKIEGDGKGDFIFKHLNSRIMKLFPNFIKKEEALYYPMLGSIKRSDYWSAISKTYYKNLFENSILPDILTKQLIKTMDKSGYVSLGLRTVAYLSEENQEQNKYTTNNYKELMLKDKKALLKEFSQDNVKTNFVDPSLFNCEEVKILGHLDSFYEAPLLFANPGTDLFGEGVDILFSTILKLLELNKNIQVIICVEGGLKKDFIRTWVNFLSENKAFSGRWVFIDGKLNYSKFFAGADMFLLPERTNNLTVKHLFGMQYGCVPIVSKEGFLNDSVIDIFDNVSIGNGFKTKISLLTENDKSLVYYDILLKALEIYKNNSASWNILVRNCLETDVSWNFKKLEKYDMIYQEIL